MTTYKRRITDTIEATRFTSDLGGIVRGVTRGEAPDGLEYSEHSGYSFHGQRVAFGDYLVGRSIVGAEEFERQWELATVYGDDAAHVREGKRLSEEARAMQGRRVEVGSANPVDDAAKEIFGVSPGSLNEALSDVPSHVKPPKRSKRTETPGE